MTSYCHLSEVTRLLGSSWEGRRKSCRFVAASTFSSAVTARRRVCRGPNPSSQLLLYSLSSLHRIPRSMLRPILHPPRPLIPPRSAISPRHSTLSLPSIDPRYPSTHRRVRARARARRRHRQSTTIILSKASRRPHDPEWGLATATMTAAAQSLPL